jgi:hypothetical protein
MFISYHYESESCSSHVIFYILRKILLKVFIYFLEDNDTIKHFMALCYTQVRIMLSPTYKFVLRHTVPPTEFRGPGAMEFRGPLLQKTRTDLLNDHTFSVLNCGRSGALA